MKVWFTRDLDGTPSTWRYKKRKPVFNKDEGMWFGEHENLITDDTVNTARKFGRGFKGVKKGEIKLCDLEVLCKGRFCSDLNF